MQLITDQLNTAEVRGQLTAGEAVGICARGKVRQWSCFQMEVFGCQSSVELNLTAVVTEDEVLLSDLGLVMVEPLNPAGESFPKRVIN